MIPGVSTGIDLDSGLHIDGFDSMHNLISVDGVPLYGPGHLFGFFPIFNMIHHGTMTVSPVAGHVGRLGGSLDMSFDRALPQRTGIALNVGTIALDGSAAVKLGPKAAVFVSGRHSFLSSLYSRKLKIEDMPMDYSMDDVNLTLLVRSGGNDLVWADAFFSNDALGLDNCLIDEGTLGSAWKNGFASLHWQHSAESWSMDQTAYFSAFSNRTEVHAIDMDLVLPNSFSTIGYRATLTAGRLFAGLDAGIHAAEVQDPQETLGARRAAEVSLLSGYRFDFGDDVSADIGADFQYYRMVGERPCFSVSPSVLLEYDLHRGGTLALRTYFKSQYIFKNGLSNIGLPLEFWHLAGGGRRPQRAVGADLTHKFTFGADAFSLASELFFSKLFNQCEYVGTLYDLTAASYRMEDYLVSGDGMSYGLNLRLEKNAGSLTGWAGGSLGRSLRRFDGMQLSGWYPANHERIFELNATATYDFGRVHPGAAFVWATGTPFTAPDSFYLLSGHLVSHYAGHNSCRLRPYSRLDLSCSIDLKGGERFKHKIDLSVYNVLCRKNDIFYRLRFSGSEISYLPYRYCMTFIPSVCYKCEF